MSSKTDAELKLNKCRYFSTMSRATFFWSLLPALQHDNEEARETSLQVIIVEGLFEGYEKRPERKESGNGRRDEVRQASLF